MTIWDKDGRRVLEGAPGVFSNLSVVPGQLTLRSDEASHTLMLVTSGRDFYGSSLHNYYFPCIKY